MDFFNRIFFCFKLYRALIVIFLFFLFSFKSFAQVYATKYTDLDFGDVFIGYPAEVNHADAAAAKFRFFHFAFFRRDMQITFSLPSRLNYQSFSMPITFDASHSAWSYNDNTNGRTNFNPHSPLYLNNVLLLTPVYVWLGGKLNSTAGVQPGTYQGTIIVTVEIF